jgi:hypothetical protein
VHSVYYLFGAVPFGFRREVLYHEGTQEHRDRQKNEIIIEAPCISGSVLQTLEEDGGRKPYYRAGHAGKEEPLGHAYEENGLFKHPSSHGATSLWSCM